MDDLVHHFYLSSTLLPFSFQVMEASAPLCQPADWDGGGCWSHGWAGSGKDANRGKCFPSFAIREPPL